MSSKTPEEIAQGLPDGVAVILAVRGLAMKFHRGILGALPIRRFGSTCRPWGRVRCTPIWSRQIFAVVGERARQILDEESRHVS